MTHESHRNRLGPLMAIAAALALPAPALAHFFSHNSVDDGQIRYVDHTRYPDDVKRAVDVWNALGRIDIRPDGWSTLCDLRWRDADRPDVTWVGRYIAVDGRTDDILLNVYYMERYSRTKRRTVTAHEQGHALGLGHSYAEQLMQEFPVGSGITTPQSHDIADYRTLWR